MPRYIDVQVPTGPAESNQLDHMTKVRIKVDDGGEPLSYDEQDTELELMFYLRACMALNAESTPKKPKKKQKQKPKSKKRQK